MLDIFQLRQLTLAIDKIVVLWRKIQLARECTLARKGLVKEPVSEKLRTDSYKSVAQIVGEDKAVFTA